MKRAIVVAVLTAVFVGGIGTAQAGVVTNLVGDPGFEELVLADDPSTNSTPWFAIEDVDNRVVREQGIVNDGTNAVKLVAWKKSTVLQNLGSGFTLDSNTVYELNFYMRFDNYVEAKSNDHTRVKASCK